MYSYVIILYMILQFIIISNIKVAIEHGPFIVDLPMKDGDFP